MKFLAMISLRNLFRQKRRNILLGISIGVGVMILIVANSFSHGISDVMFNRIIRYVTGHVSVAFYEKNRIFCQIFRDKDRMMKTINACLPPETQLDEGVGIPCRAVGNGHAETVMLVGVDTTVEVSEKLRREYEQSFRMMEGKFESLHDETIENPAILSTDKASDLNVKVNDILRVRYKNIFGQDQAERLTVVGIMKITNIFMSGVVFVELKNTKKLLGYRPWEVGSLNISLDNPKEESVKVADRIHKALSPKKALIPSVIKCKEKQANVSVLPFLNDEETKKIILNHAPLIQGEAKEALGKKGVLLTQALSEQLGARAGEKIEMTYENKFDGKRTAREYAVTGVISLKNCLSDRVMLLNENLFYDTFYDNLPIDASGDENYDRPLKTDPLYGCLGEEWILLPRTKTTDDFKKKMKATSLDVSTMYETASDILKLESALNIITFIAVLILFFIILIGVVNTLRMTIRERTREIGTMRAIGMQKKDVRNVFMLETLFLTLFSSLAGTAGAFLVMHLVSRMTLNMKDNPLGMFLVEDHLYFLPTFSGILFNISLILFIAAATAWFPARRAASLTAAEAFRHHE